MEEQFYTITQACRDICASRARVTKEGRITRARVRGLVEWRRVRRHRPARDAEIGIHGCRTLRYRERERSIRMRSTRISRRRGRCAASAYRSSCGPTRATRISSRGRSSIDPLEFRRRNILREGRPQATGTLMRTQRSSGCSTGLPARMNWERAVRSRHRDDPPRARHRHRDQGEHLADDVRRHRERVRRRQLRRLLQHGRYGAGIRHGDRADRC